MKSGVKEIICDAEQMNDPKKLHITAKNDDKHAMIMSIQGVGSQFSGKIYAKANNKVIKKCVVIPRNNERAFSDVKDLTMYLGTGESASKDITLKLYAGTHHYPCNYDRIVLYQVPLETYDKTAQVLQANRIRTKSFKNDIYKGNVKCKKDSVVYFSILDDGGWDVYADGRKCKKIKDINIAFTGISLNAGEHDIELRYHSRGALGGLFITLAGIAILLIIVKKRRKALALSEQ